jgi:hypothetical protein
MTMKRLSRHLERFNALSWPERRTFLVALLWFPLFRIGLYVLGLNRIQAVLQRKPLGICQALSLDELKQVGMQVNRAARYGLFADTCLTRSLLLGWLLRRKGIDTQLRIGVRLIDGTLDAHAWVEYAGIPINDRIDIGSVYSPFSGSVATGSFHTP